MIASGARYRRLDVANLEEFEGIERPLLGLAARGQALRRAGSGAGRRRQLRGPGGRVSGEPVRARSGCSCASEPRRDDVALSRRPHRGAAERRGRDTQRRSARSRDATACWKPSAGDVRGTRRRAGRSAISSSSSAPTRTPIGWPAPTSRSTTRGSCAPGADVGAGLRPLQTSRPGVFAIGDVRAGSVKRVAAAVGEGAQVVAMLHALRA